MLQLSLPQELMLSESTPTLDGAAGSLCRPRTVDMAIPFSDGWMTRQRTWRPATARRLRAG
jgi:hypothetical protein